MCAFYAKKYLSSQAICGLINCIHCTYNNRDQKTTTRPIDAAKTNITLPAFCNKSIWRTSTFQFTLNEKEIFKSKVFPKLNIMPNHKLIEVLCVYCYQKDFAQKISLLLQLRSVKNNIFILIVKVWFW